MEINVIKKSFRVSALFLMLLLPVGFQAFAQQPESIYGDEVKFDVRMKYVYTMEDAIVASQKTGKPIFMNCFADWAVPCHGMNKYVFSNQGFADWMDNHFVCLFMDMKSEEGKSLAEQYNVNQFAQYLVLNTAGDVLLRIYGGSRLPDFQDKVALALSDKTNEPGATRAYQSGKRDKRTLLNYLNILDITSNVKEYRSVDSVYVPMLREKDYTLKENWTPITRYISEPEGKIYEYLISHKSDFVASVGEEKVNRALENLFGKVYWYASGDSAYNGQRMLALFREMTRAELPDSSVIRNLYKVAKLRGEGKTDQLYTYLLENRRQLDRYALYLDMSLTKGEKDDIQKSALVGYYKKAIELEPNPRYKKRLEDAIAELQAVSGISFLQDKTFDEVLSIARMQNKLVFMDCYTSWCGPCKAMASRVFTQEKVGEYFNANFVSVKMNMETEEGRPLAKKYKIEAYPTMLILDADGKELKRIVGYQESDELINKASLTSNP